MIARVVVVVVLEGSLESVVGHGEEMFIKARLSASELLETGSVNRKPCAKAELQSTELNVENMIISPTRHDTQSALMA